MGRRLRTSISVEQARRLLAATEDSPRDYALIATLLYTGARCNEATSLNVGDIDFRQQTVFIRKAKGGKQRLLSLHPQLAATLEPYLSTIPAFPDSALFWSRNGRRLSNRQVRRLVSALGRRIGVPWLDTHTLRHTFASQLLEVSVDLKTIQQLLGHASLGTTEIYLHPTMERLREAVERLEF